jgi:hypothetical protein
MYSIIEPKTGAILAANQAPNLDVSLAGNHKNPNHMIDNDAIRANQNGADRFIKTKNRALVTAIRVHKTILKLGP